MPAKSGLSHALASFVTIIAGAVISGYLSVHASVLWDLTRTAGKMVTWVLGINLPTAVTGMLVIATVLSFVWGVAYHYSRHGSSDGTRRATRPWHK
jgi:hypothetical protein